jgi:SAM-dependent methyltransferase
MTIRWKVAQWFELRWWKMYLRDKEQIEYLGWKKKYWKNVLSKLSDKVEIDPSKIIADLGCGPSGIFIALPQNKIIAIDPLLEEYEAQTPFFKKSDYPNCTFIKGTIEEFDIKTKYDLVFCMNAINHVGDIQKGFRQIKDATKDNGTLVLSIDAHNHEFFKHLFRLVPGDILHPHQFNLGEYTKMLETGGWKITGSYLLKEKFFFDHYLMVAQKQ